MIAGPVRIGAGTRLLAHVFLQGPMTIGEGNTFYPNACVGFPPQHRQFDPDHPGSGVAIGDRNVLREGVTIHRATSDTPTTLGDDNYLMVNSHVGHDTIVGDGCTLANGALLGGHVELGDHAFLGGNAAVHQHCRVGRLAIISGVAVVSQDVPPFCTVYVSRAVGSLNYVGMRRAGLRKHVANLKQAFDIVYHQGLGNPGAIDRIEREFADDPLCVEFARFIKTTKRGIVGYASLSQNNATPVSEPAAG